VAERIALKAAAALQEPPRSADGKRGRRYSERASDRQCDVHRGRTEWHVWDAPRYDQCNQGAVGDIALDYYSICGLKDQLRARRRPNAASVDGTSHPQAAGHSRSVERAW